jgi:hypothetical protein
MAEPQDNLPFKKARSLCWFPVPDDWVPSPEERLWLEELEALTDDEIRQLDRFSPAVGGVEVVPEDEL